MGEMPNLALAERVVAVASSLSIDTALIGAMALAVHGFVRATQDVDLGASVSSLEQLQDLEQRLREVGLRTHLRLPDEADPLGGVLQVWEQEDSEGEPLDPVELVNFFNPLHPRRNPGAVAIRRASPLQAGSVLKCVGLADLIALKLAAGSLADTADVVALIERNPEADEVEIRATCAQYGLSARLDALLEPPSGHDAS